MNIGKKLYCKFRHYSRAVLVLLAINLYRRASRA